MKNKLFVLLFFLPFIGYSQSSIITTIAGGGISSADGIPATASTLNLPTGIAVDALGNIYIADQGNDRIRKVNTSGVITTIAGTGVDGYSGDGGPASTARLSSPYGIVVDAIGNIYFSESDNHCIRKINTSGIITTIAGTGVSGYSGDGGPATAAKLNFPIGLVFDQGGNLYIGDRLNNRIRKVNTSGIITTFVSGISSYGVAADGLGNIYFEDVGSFRIKKIDTSGTIFSTIAGIGTDTCTGDNGPAIHAGITFAFNFTSDTFGNIYFPDYWGQRVRKINTFGIINSIAGNGYGAGVSVTGGYTGDGGPATAAKLNHPAGTALSRDGSVYFADRSNNVIRKIHFSPDYVADSFSVYITNSCTGPQLTVLANRFSPTFYIKTYFGDNSYDSSVFAAGFGRGVAIFNHVYGFAGTYTIKQVLYDGATAIDSIQFTDIFSLCNTIDLKFYFDANSNCVKDGSEFYISQPVLTEVDSNGVPIDTISTTSGLYYTAYGVPGDIYDFKVLSTPPGYYSPCYTSAIISDTLSVVPNNYKDLYFGLSCNSLTTFDLAVNPVISPTGTHRQNGNIYITNTSCYPTTASVSMSFSPKYVYGIATPAPSSVSGNTITWNFSSVAVNVPSPLRIYYHLDYNLATGYLISGDTVHSHFVITPFSGDVDTNNNNVFSIDTAKASLDPNEMSVNPNGYIPLTTGSNELQYTIAFENTGNDTAYNIYILDTLPTNVDPSTMRIVMSSAQMFVSKLVSSTGQTILKFDFPGINLLDSTHHGQCDGAIIFNIQTMSALPLCTTILNRAGIYFDYNSVVMTNTVENIVGATPDPGIISGPDSVCIGNTIILLESSAGGTWNSSNGNATVSGGIVTGNIIGTDTIYYSVTNACGTIANTYKVINIKGGIDCNVISEVNTVTNPFFVNISPNPTFSELTITSTNKISNIIVSNFLGQVVYRGQYNNGKVQINVANFPKGVYFIKINDSEVRKFVKQ